MRNPGDVYDGLRLRPWNDIRDISAYRKKGQVNAQIPPSSEAIVEATGWHRNPDGKVELIAVQSPAYIQAQLNCAAISKK